jgi:thymidylate synthase
MYQFYVEADGRLSVQMTQRSSDVFLGLPFNIASTALLVHLIAHQVDIQPGRVIIRIGDTHIYEEHIEACQQQDRKGACSLPTITIERPKDDDLWKVERKQIQLHNYTPGSIIKAEMKA